MSSVVKRDLAAVIVPTAEAKAAGLIQAEPEDFDPQLAKNVWIDGLRGPKAYVMVLNKDAPPVHCGVHLDKAEAFLLLKAVQRHAQKNDVDQGWHDLLREKGSAEPFPDMTERQFLPLLITRTRASCTGIGLLADDRPKSQGDGFNIVGYKPPHEAFTDLGFYSEFYKISWSVTGEEVWLDDTIENGDLCDRRCTWEPRSCLSDADGDTEAQVARLKWCDRMEALLTLRGENCKDLMVVPKDGSPATPVPPPSIRPPPGTYTPEMYERAMEKIMTYVDRYFKAGETFTLEGMGTHKLKSISSGHNWAPARSERSARCFGTVPLNAFTLQLELPVDDYELIAKQPKQPSHEEYGMPLSKKRRTVVTTECLGKGTFGTVLRGQVLENGDDIAVKAGTQIEICIHEAAILSRVQHRNIVTFHGAEQLGEEVKMLLEYVPKSLDRVMAAENLEPTVIARYGADIFMGLAYCHSLNLVHCDMKPANLLVYPDSQVLKLADFGESDYVGKVFDRIFYTRWWRPPEVVFGERERACSMDIWAAGAVLGEMVGKAPLFHSEGIVDLVARIMWLVDPDVSPPVYNWRAVIGSRATFCTTCLGCAERCLRWDPAQRDTAQAIVDALAPSAKRTP